MIREIILRPEAESDIAEAYSWYEDLQTMLGDQFLDSIDRALNTIIDNPESSPIVHRDIRRALIRRFPFGVFYIIEEKRIVVIAILHASRDPKHWQVRE